MVLRGGAWEPWTGLPPPLSPRPSFTLSFWPLGRRQRRGRQLLGRSCRGHLQHSETYFVLCGFSFHKLFSAQASVDRALGRVKVRSIVNELSGRPQRTKGCDRHWDEVQLRCGYQKRILRKLLLLFGSAFSFDVRVLSPRLGASGCVTVTSTAAGSGVVHRSTKISAGHSRPSICTSVKTRLPVAQRWSSTSR